MLIPNLQVIFISWGTFNHYIMLVGEGMGVVIFVESCYGKIEGEG